MSKGLVILDIPDCCAECHFRDKLEEHYLGDGHYTKISRCRLAPYTIEDPWRDIRWQMMHKESWCPIKPVPAKFDADAPWAGDYEQGYNDCIDKILEEGTR